MTDARSEQQQTALPGFEPADPDEWIVTVEDAGLTYAVCIEAMTRREAGETFTSEFQMYELGLYDDEFDWDHETVFARSTADAEAIALARDPDEIGREYMRVYETSPLGNSADIVSIDRLSDVDGWRSRKAHREAQVVADE